MNVLILAAERPEGDALAQAEGVTGKAWIRIAGKPMLQYVTEALAPFGPHYVSAMAGPLPGVTWVSPAHSPCSSVLRAMETLSYPVLLTTADHPLLTTALVQQFLDAAAQQPGDLCVGLVRLELVQARYPGNRRTKLRFSDGSYSGANLFLLRNERCAELLHFWQRIEAQRKSPWRMVRVLGLGSIWRYALGRLSLADVIAVIARRTHVQVSPVLLDDAHAAVDVDRPGDLALVRQILEAA